MQNVGFGLSWKVFVVVALAAVFAVTSCGSPRQFPPGGDGGTGGAGGGATDGGTDAPQDHVASDAGGTGGSAGGGAGTGGATANDAGQDASSEDAALDAAPDATGQGTGGFSGATGGALGTGGSSSSGTGGMMSTGGTPGAGGRVGTGGMAGAAGTGGIRGTGGTAGTSGSGGATGSGGSPTCTSSQHLCSGACVANSSTSSCGTSCTPCTAPAGGTATCNGTTCDFTCGSMKKCGSKCIATGACCIDTDCPMQSGKTGQCDSMTNTCSYSCATNYKPCGASCIPSTNCCSSNDCTAPQVCGASGACGCPAATPDLCGAKCVDKKTDPTNCGTCGHDCTALPNVTAASVQCSSTGACVIPTGACKAGFANCTSSGTETDGCETATNTTSNCGGCGKMCSVTGGTAKCNTDGTCGVASCDSTHHTCSGANACYSNTDASHCGSSCTACSAPTGATATCQNNTCGFQCNSGFACGGQCYSDNVAVTCGSGTTCAAWDFESGLQGWVVPADFESNVSLNTAAAPAGRGGKALILTFPVQPTKVLGIQVDLCSQAANILGRSVKASLYIDATTAPGSFGVYSLLNGVEQGDFGSVPARTWTTVTLGFAGGEGSTKQIGLSVDPGTATEGKVYVDDVQIVP